MYEHEVTFLGFLIFYFHRSSPKSPLLFVMLFAIKAGKAKGHWQNAIRFAWRWRWWWWRWQWLLQKDLSKEYGIIRKKKVEKEINPIFTWTSDHVHSGCDAWIRIISVISAIKETNIINSTQFFLSLFVRNETHTSVWVACMYPYICVCESWVFAVPIGLYVTVVKHMIGK